MAQSEGDTFSEAVRSGTNPTALFRATRGSPLPPRLPERRSDADIGDGGDGPRPDSGPAAGSRTRGTVFHKNRSDKWSPQEIDSLKELCAPYSSRIPWKLVVWPEFRRLYGEKRTQAALAAKWQELRREGFPASAPEDTTTATPLSEGNGDGGTPPSEPIRQPTPVRFDTTGDLPDNGATTPPLNVTGATPGDGVAIPQLFRKTFNGFYGRALRQFERRGVLPLYGNCSTELLEYADAMVASYYSRGCKPGVSRYGMLNALVYASARTVERFHREGLKAKSEGEREWFL